MRQAYNGSAVLRYQTLPIVHYNETTPAIRLNILECLVPMCRVGDLFIIEGQFGTTNDLGYSVEVARKVIFSETSGSISGDLVTRESGHNVSPQIDLNNNVWHGMHHGMFTFTGLWQIPRTVAADCYFSVVVYAGGGTPTKDGDTLKLEQSQGYIKWARLN